MQACTDGSQALGTVVAVSPSYFARYVPADSRRERGGRAVVVSECSSDSREFTTKKIARHDRPLVSICLISLTAKFA